MKYPSTIPFHLQACLVGVFFFFFHFCYSDDKVSHLEFYLISEDEKELKASSGGWAHLTLSRILQKEDEWLGKGSCPQRMEFIPGSELHPGFSFTWGDHPADPTAPSLLSWGMASRPGCTCLSPWNPLLSIQSNLIELWFWSCLTVAEILLIIRFPWETWKRGWWRREERQGLVWGHLVLVRHQGSDTSARLHPLRSGHILGMDELTECLSGGWTLQVLLVLVKKRQFPWQSPPPWCRLEQIQHPPALLVPSLASSHPAWSLCRDVAQLSAHLPSLMHVCGWQQLIMGIHVWFTQIQLEVQPLGWGNIPCRAVLPPAPDAFLSASASWGKHASCLLCVWFWG